MLERLYRYLDQQIIAIENELGAIKSFRPFALSSIFQALNLFVTEILKSLVAILILLTKDPTKSFEVLRTPAPAYSFEIHTAYHKRIRFFSFYGLGSVVAAVVVISLVLNLLTPASQIPSFAATFSTTWTSQGDFESNTVTSQGATTRTNVDTTSTAGSVKLSTVGTDITFTETFTGTTNIDTANSADSASGVSGGQLALATGTATDLSSLLSGSATWMNIATDTFTRADNTDIATGSSIAWVERAGNWDILTNRLNLNTASAVAVARTGTMPVADYTVQAIVNSATTAAQEGIVGRRVDFGTDDSNGYFLHIQPGTGLNLQKRVSGAWTSLGSFATTITTATDYTIKLSMQGSTIKGFLDGIERISVVDASITAAGDAGVKAENLGFKVDNFTVDYITPPTINALARASNGDIYVGAAGGKFGKYTPGTNTFTDLTSKISSFWGTYAIESLAYDSVNNVVYLGGGEYSGAIRFAKYTIGSDTATDLTSTLSGVITSNMFVSSLVVDTTNGVVYLGQYATGEFAKYTISSNTATNLTSRISSFWGVNSIRRLAWDATNSIVYIVGGDVGICRFAKYTISSDTATNLGSTVCAIETSYVSGITYDTTNNMVYLGGGTPGGGLSGKFIKYNPSSDTSTDLTSQISAFWDAANIIQLVLDTTNSIVYLAGQIGKFAKYTISSNTTTNLNLKISGFWDVNDIHTLAYDSTNAMIYLGGAGGKFAKFTAVGNTQSVQSNAVDTLATNIAYATLTKNDTLDSNASDNFNRADNADLGPLWDVVPTEANLTITANTVTPSSLFSGDKSESNNSVTWPNDQYSQAKIYAAGGTSGGGDGPGVAVRMSSSAKTYYRLVANKTATNNIEISKHVTGVFTSLGFRTATWTDGDVLRLEVSGTTLKAFLNGTQLGADIADSSISSGRPGLAYSSGEAMTSASMDDWSGGRVEVKYYLSNDNGTTFTQVVPGTKYNFTTNGSALKWKAVLVNTGVSPTVQDLTIVYNGYNTTGTITNLKQDAGGDAVWGTISWNATTPTGTATKFRTRGATAAQGVGALGTAPWSPYYTTSGASITNESGAINPTYRYLEAEMFLDSGTTGGTATPTVNDFTVAHVINAAPEITSITASQSGTDGKVTVNFSVRDTDTNTGTTNPGRANLSLEYCTNAPTCSTWTAATTVTGDVGLKQVCDGSGGSGGLNCALTQYTAYSIVWTPATDYANQYSSGFKVRVRANDNEGAFNNGYGESAAFEFDTKAPTLGSPSIKIDGTNKTLTLSATDDNAQTPQIQMQFAKTCGALTGSWLTYATPYDASSIIGTDNPITICGQFRDFYKNTTATVSVSTLAAPANLLLQDTTNKDISQYQMFLSWGVVASATKYHIYRSTDGFATRTEVGTITSPSAPNTNYLTDTNFSTNSAAANYWNKTYSYRVTAEDSDTDESIYSPTKSGTPDGTTQAEEGGGTITTIVGRKVVDITAPALSSVNVKDITPETAGITWTTDEISDSTAYYGTDKTFSNRQSVNSLVTGHTVELTGLTPNQTYYFKVASSDTSGNTGSDDNKGNGYTFKTLVKDADPPKIFNVSIVSSATLAKISWETDEAATSYVDYTQNTNKNYDKTAGSAEFVTKHEVIVKELTPQNEYRLRVNSSDKQKNKTTSSEFVFTTISLEEQADVLGDLETLLLQEGRTGYEKLSKILAKTSSSLPAPKILGDTPRVEVTSTSAVIRWATDVPSNSMIALSPDSQYSAAAADPYIMTAGNFAEETLAHEVTLINLAPATLYHYQLRSKPAFGPEGRSRDLTFQTRSLAPEIFGEGTRKVSQNQATIVWSTNVQSDSLARYTPYRDGKPNLTETKLQGSPDLVFDHAITLIGLEYGTLYAIELQSTDRLGNVITKTLKPFATSIDLEPPKVSQIRTESAIVSGAREQVQTIIFWKTDEPATSQVVYQEGIAEDKALERSTVEDQSLTQNHVTVITSFKAGSVYRFKVRSRDAYGNTIESSPFTILAPTQKETVFQIILKNFEDTFGWVRKLKL